jgi:phosphomannomutase
MKKVIAFDLDGTLAPSKSPLPPRIGELLNQLLDKFQVCVISGGKFEQFEKQLLRGLKTESAKLQRLHIMPTCGTRYYTFDVTESDWKNIYAEDFSDDEKQAISSALEKGLDELGMREEKIYGEIIEDRGSQVTLSVLGQDIVDELGPEGVRIKEEWDPDNKKKEAIRALVAPQIPEFEVKVGGLTSIDVTKPGIDKAYGMKKLTEALQINQEDILFIGDRLRDGGNDYPVKAMGIDSLEISSWQETAVAIQAILYVS